MKKFITPAEFEKNVKSRIESHYRDEWDSKELLNEYFISLMKDTLITLGYESGISMIEKEMKKGR